MESSQLSTEVFHVGMCMYMYMRLYEIRVNLLDPAWPAPSGLECHSLSELDVPSKSMLLWHLGIFLILCILIVYVTRFKKQNKPPKYMYNVEANPDYNKS